MGFTTLNLGLSLTIPTDGTTNWGTTVFNTTWKRISQHQHTGGGDGNQIPTAGIANNAITTAKLAKNLGQEIASTLTPVGTSQTVNFNNGIIQRINLGSASGDVTLTLSNPENGGIYWIIVEQGATPRDLVWPASVKWPQAQKPILSDANKTDLIVLMYDGSVYRGLWELDFS